MGPARGGGVPAFNKLKEERSQARLPIVEVFRTQYRSVLTTIGLRACEGVFSYLILTFSLSYGTDDLDMSRTPILLATTVAAALIGCAYPLFGTLSDRVGRRPSICSARSSRWSSPSRSPGCSAAVRWSCSGWRSSSATPWRSGPRTRSNRLCSPSCSAPASATPGSRWDSSWPRWSPVASRRPSPPR
ncbi:hypothetical protein NKH77_46895 [Streptomyces sp. M19]